MIQTGKTGLPSSGEYTCGDFKCFGGTHSVFSLYDAEDRKTKSRATLFVYDKRMFRLSKLSDSFLELAQREFDLDMQSIMLTKLAVFENDAYLVFATRPVLSTLYGLFSNKGLVSKLLNEPLADPSIFAFNFVSVLHALSELNELTFSHHAISSSNLVFQQDCELTLTGAYFVSATPDKVHVSNPVFRPDIMTPQGTQNAPNSDVAMFIISLVDAYFKSEKSPTQSHLQAIQQIMNYKLTEEQVFADIAQKLVFLVDLDFSKQKCLGQLANFKEDIVKAASGQFSARQLLDKLVEEPVMRAYLGMKKLQPNALSIQNTLLDILEQKKSISRPLFGRLLLPKLVAHLKDTANHELVVKIVCQQALQHKMDVSQLYFVFEPIVLALTAEEFRRSQNGRSEPFKAYTGFQFESAYLRYENPYAALAPPKLKQLSQFVPDLGVQLRSDAQNEHFGARLALLSSFDFFLSPQASGECHLLALQFLHCSLASSNPSVVQAALVAARSALPLMAAPSFLQGVEDKQLYARPLTHFLVPQLTKLLSSTGVPALAIDGFECFSALLEFVSESDVREVLLPQLRALVPVVRASEAASAAFGALFVRLVEKVQWQWFMCNCLQLLGQVMEGYQCDALLRSFKLVCASVAERSGLGGAE